MFCPIQPAVRHVFFGLLFIAVSLVSCDSNRLDVDVSGIRVPATQIPRFDRDLFAIKAENVAQNLPALRKNYPGFADLFIRNILCPNGVDDNGCVPEIIRFVNDKDMREAYDDCQKVFPDMTAVESDLQDAFKHYLYYYPNSHIPKVVAMMSGFQYAIAYADTSISIGLEMYLGNKSKFYDMLRFPQYKRVNMRKEYIVSDIVHAWAAKAYPEKGKSGTLLNEMIYQGKLLYLVDALMPHASDTIKIGFSKEQLDWCNTNQKNVWGFFIANELLYSNDVKVLIKYTGEGPSTTGFVKESPARTGVWIGWQIVRKYMDNNPKVTLDQLMHEMDAQKILANSKYKP